MIFKRKQARPVGVGDIVKINSKVMQKMINLDSYKLNSLCNYLCLVGRTMMSNKHLRGSKSHPSKIMAADIKLFYAKNSIFGSNLLEIVPLSVSLDNPSAIGVKKLIGAKKTFFIKKSCLERTTSFEVENLTNHYSDYSKNWIKNAMGTHFNINNFEWQNR